MNNGRRNDGMDTTSMGCLYCSDTGIDPCTDQSRSLNFYRQNLHYYGLLCLTCRHVVSTVDFYGISRSDTPREQIEYRVDVTRD